MSALFLSFVASLVVTMAGREQLRVARLAGVLGVRAGLIVAIGISAVVTSAFAAWVGTVLAASVPGALTRFLMVMALLLAVPQLVLLRAKPAPKEPTWSFGAMLLVLLVVQICDAGRLVVLALTLQTGQPVFVAAGGALGSGLALLVASLAGAEWERRIPHSTLSQGIGALLLAVALSIGTSVL